MSEISNAQIYSYLDNRLPLKERNFIEQKVLDSESNKHQFESLKSHRDFLVDLIPDTKITRKTQMDLSEQLADISQSIMDKNPNSPLKRVYKLLTKTVIEF